MCIINNKRLSEIVDKWTIRHFDKRLLDWTVVECVVAIGILKHLIQRDENVEETFLFCRGISDVLRWKEDDIIMYDEDFVRNIYKHFDSNEIELFKSHVVKFYNWIDDPWKCFGIK